MGYFPPIWKISLIIMMPKVGKDLLVVQTNKPYSVNVKTLRAGAACEITKIFGDKKRNPTPSIWLQSKTRYN